MTRTGAIVTNIWSAPAERSGDGALTGRLAAVEATTNGEAQENQGTAVSELPPNTMAKPKYLGPRSMLQPSNSAVPQSGVALSLATAVQKSARVL